MYGYRCLFCLSVLLLVGLAPGYGQEHAFFYPSPHTSLVRSRQLLDAADVRVMLPLGLRVHSDPGASGLGSRRGVVESRVYIGAEGRTVELALLQGVAGGYDFAVLTPPERASKLLTQVYERFVELAGQVAFDDEAVDLAYQTYRLGHIDANRAVAILKALDYNTVEFERKEPGRNDENPEEIFELVRGKKKDLPLVLKVLNAGKTSPLEPDPEDKSKRTSSSSSSSSRSKGIEGAPQLGGSHLHGVTEGAPQERLLLVYDRDDPEALERLVNLLHDHVDVAAHQIVIEALVIEVNTNRLRDLGVEISGTHDNASAGFERSDGVDLPFTFLLTRNGFSDFIDFKAKLEALTESGGAEVLSSPSVLVLNDRQARIQVGQQIPVVRSTTTVSTTTSSVEYFPIGIVLNLRPRISPDGSEVTMQIQTIISSVSQSTEFSGGASSQVAFAPVVDNRQVETYVRVADGTPFIIGGLLSTQENNRRVSVPLLSGIPLLGRLFVRERNELDRREVIVVITPHIVPLDERSFSYLIPKDSDLFDRFETRLFRNAYRVRDDEVWDLKFVQESPGLLDLLARLRLAATDDVLMARHPTVARLLDGQIPGEEVLVRRMLADIIEKLDFGREIDLEKAFFFEAVDHKASADRFIDRPLGPIVARALAEPDSAVLLRYTAQGQPQPGKPFTYPVATVSDTVVAEAEELAFLRRANPVDDQGHSLGWSIVLRGEDDVKRLQRALILKRLLELNEQQPLTLRNFKPGLQILFPSRSDMRSRYHLVDRQVAQLFYESAPDQYYPAFQRIFEKSVAEVEALLGGGQ
jgi:general secretion pathway protein D